MRRFPGHFIGIVLAIAQPIISLPAIAQTVPSPAKPTDSSMVGACGRPVNLPDKLPTTAVDKFKSNPSGLLKKNPIGGLELSSEVKGLVISDPASSVDVLLEAARSSNSTQAAAIGTGLGQAVKAIMAVNNVCADDIARKIAGVGLTDVLSGYNLVQVDAQTLLIGSNESLGGGIGGAVNEAGNSSTASASGATTSASGSASTANTAETFSFSGSTVTCTTSVSPRRRC